MTRTERIAQLRQNLEERILVLDGAMGTAIQTLNLSADDFGGESLEGCNEHLVLTQPEVIRKIHLAHLVAGADIVETDTFGGTPLVLAEYGLEDQTIEINRAAAKIAREAAAEYSTADRLRFVAGSMGPTTKAISVTGGVTFEALTEHYFKQAQGLYEGGADYLLLETCQDMLNVKAGLIAIQRLLKERNAPIPVAVSFTIEPTGTMLAGPNVEAAWAALAHQELLYVGLNCATGPEFMTDSLRSLAEISSVPVACVPNAGLPDEDGHYLETPEMMSRVLERFLSEGWVRLIGGCCGTTAMHIERFAELARKHHPRHHTSPRRSFLSGIDYLELTDDNRPIIVGERTNVIGSRKFKELIGRGDFEAGAEIARAQVKSGAQVIDVCLADPDRDELVDMRMFLERATRMVRAPLMIDTTSAEVAALALTYSQGKAILNSINLEDGEERFEKVVPLARSFGAALVVGTIDDDPQQGMALTRDRKLAVARRSYDLLTKKYGVLPEDIYWDCLVFPCATGDPQYEGTAVETIEGLRLVKAEFPQTKTILGISNVSFGLPPAGREVLNSVFLYHCTQAGLDMAIVNAQQLRRYPSLDPKEKELAENLLFGRSPDALAAFAAYFRDRKAAPSKKREELSLEERLASYIVDGTKEGLLPDLQKALKKYPPLEIINGPLMKGMDEVGKLFNENKLIVAEVLQSAESMKAAVNFLKPFMEKSDQSLRGTVVLATVKGDVHDIGKNLVEIILTNNGFHVINLGIKVPPEGILGAVREHSPQIIGLSGLLVKSAQQMVTTAEDLTRAGVKTPMLVGGAALTRSFVDRRIARAYAGDVMYASDAMNGLELAKIIVDATKFPAFREQLEQSRKDKASEAPIARPEAAVVPHRSTIQPVTPPPPPDFETHVLGRTPIEEIWAYINPRMLFGRHLGVPNSDLRWMEEGKSTPTNRPEHKIAEIFAAVEEVKAICRRDRLLRPQAVYRFVRATAEGTTIHFLSENGEKLAQLPFPRQVKPPYLSIADYLHPLGSSVIENLCLFVVTSGFGVRERATEWKDRGDYLKSHILSALALESAEGYAEWLHARIRGMWGLHDPSDLSKMDLFKGKYRGRRYSFGYGACPDLGGQKVLFDLLEPEQIGVTLTEGFMMDPEASVSALVFHHPEATYFDT